MGMTMHVVALKSPTPDFEKKRQAYFACKAACIPIPRELEKFFNDREPDGRAGIGMEIDVPHEKWAARASEGFEVDITKLPEGVTHIRFYCSW